MNKTTLNIVALSIIALLTIGGISSLAIAEFTPVESIEEIPSYDITVEEENELISWELFSLSRGLSKEFPKENIEIELLELTALAVDYSDKPGETIYTATVQITQKGKEASTVSVSHIREGDSLKFGKGKLKFFGVDYSSKPFEEYDKITSYASPIAKFAVTFNEFDEPINPKLLFDGEGFLLNADETDGAHFNLYLKNDGSKIYGEMTIDSESLNIKGNIYGDKIFFDIYNENGKIEASFNGVIKSYYNFELLEGTVTENNKNSDKYTLTAFSEKKPIFFAHTVNDDITITQK